MARPKAAKKKTTAKVAPTKGQRLTLKGHQEFRHDLAKLEVASMKKNVSWKAYEPRIELIEHCHVFHSHTSKGKPQIYSSHQGGHFHKIDATYHDDGSVSYVCGPPLKELVKTMKNGQKVRGIGPVVYETNDPDTPDVVENHTHDVTYKFSEHLSPVKIQAQAAEDKSRLREADANFVKAVESQAAAAADTAPAADLTTGTVATVGDATIQEL